MRKAALVIIAASVVFVACGAPALAAEEKVRRLPVAEYLDKMKGAWIGQMAGVGWGQPTEFMVRAFLRGAQGPALRRVSLVAAKGYAHCQAPSSVVVAAVFGTAVTGERGVHRKEREERKEGLY